jgi:hypothetical protein
VVCPSGENQPLPAVDEFAHGVQVAGVGGGLGDHVQDDLAQVVEAPVTEEVRPPARGCLQVGAGKEGVGELPFLAVESEDLLGCLLRGGLPRVLPGPEDLFDRCLLPGSNRAENFSSSRARWCTSPRHVQPDGRTGRRSASSSRPSKMPRTCLRLLFRTPSSVVSSVSAMGRTLCGPTDTGSLSVSRCRSESSEADDATAGFEEAAVEVGAPLVAGTETLELVQPGECALNDPAHLAQSGTVCDPGPGCPVAARESTDGPP